MTPMMRDQHFVLDGRNVRAATLWEWAETFENRESRQVASTDIDGVRVSTVFLGIDHQYGDGPPLLFETMIFGGEHDEYQERYSTYDEAEAGHQAAVARVKESVTQ